MKQTVSILCHTLSGNAFGRALVIAELLQRDFNAHIVAACNHGDEIWLPARESCEFEIRRWTPATYPGFLMHSRALAKKLVTGDLVFSIKPRLTSFGLARAAQKERGMPLLLDIDDYELGFSSWSRDIRSIPWALLSTAASSHTRWLSAQTSRADAITVSSTDLHRRYGGTWIPHARDEELFAPAPPLPDSTRPPTVLFAGTPRGHKGLRDLVAAFSHVGTAARLRIVGGTLDPDLVQYARSFGDERISIEPPVGMKALRTILADADIVAIPQQASAVSESQLPAKLLDAMAMGKAIISTHVGDIPRWLQPDAGLVVPAGDISAFASGLSELIAQPARRAALGRRARARFLEFGSFKTVRPRLVSLVERVLERQPALQAAGQPFAFSGGGLGS